MNKKSRALVMFAALAANALGPFANTATAAERPSAAWRVVGARQYAFSARTAAKRVLKTEFHTVQHNNGTQGVLVTHTINGGPPQRLILAAGPELAIYTDPAVATLLNAAAGVNVRGLFGIDWPSWDDITAWGEKVWHAAEDLGDKFVALWEACVALLDAIGDAPFTKSTVKKFADVDPEFAVRFAENVAASKLRDSAAKRVGKALHNTVKRDRSGKLATALVEALRGQY